MVKTHIKERRGTKYALFEVPLPNKSPVFMSAQKTPYMNEKRGVVIVDSEKFLELWRNEPHSIHHTISHGDGQTWLKDRKYSQAVEGFDYGCDNPVPLATVSCEAYTKIIVSYKGYMQSRVG